MADAGIMALPQGQAMQDQTGALPAVSSFDAYDAAQTALGRVNPDDQYLVKEALRESIADMDLTPSQVDSLIQIFEYVSQNPDQYPSIREELIRSDYVDAEDLPEQYDPEFLGTALAILNELQMSVGREAQAPMQEEPPIAMGATPLAFAEGGLVEVAKYLAAQGRHGDTMLAHITPSEARLLKKHGGSGTINPVTGLPEFFLKKLLSKVAKATKKVLKSPVGRILATVALATVLGPAGMGLVMSKAAAAGLAGAGVTLAGGGSIKEALVAGAMGYIGGGGTIMGVNPVSAVGGYLPGAAGSAMNTGLSTAAIGAGVGKIAGMSNADALRMGAMSGASAAALQGLQNMSAAQSGGTAPAGQGLRPEVSEQGLSLKSIGTEPGLKVPDVTTPAIASSGGSSKFSLVPDAAPPPTDFSLLPGAPSSAAPTAPVTAPPTGSFNTLAQGAKKLYGDYFSPSRPGLPADAGIMQQYGPLMAVAGASSALLPKKSADQAPLFSRDATGQKYIEDNPDLFRGGLSVYQPPETPGAIIPTPSYADTQGAYGGIMSLPSTGMQNTSPYNESGLYGTPTPYSFPISAPTPYFSPVRVPGYAKGGELRETDFPRKTGPINGPGTGTSDSIPAMLSDGEFVFTAKAVRNAGGGSRRKGAARMYKLMKKLEGGPVKAK
jgi:hypothetical protein